MDDHVDELTQQLKRIQKARKRAEQTVAEAADEERSVKEQIAAATSQRRHRRPIYLRPLTLMPGLAAGGVAVAKGLMAALGRHKLATTASAAAATAVTGSSLVLITPPVQHEPHPPVTGPPPAVAGAVPSATRTVTPHRPHHDRPVAAAQEGSRTVLPVPKPSAEQSPPIPGAGEGAGQDSTGVGAPTVPPRCVTVTVGPLAKIKVLCR